MGQVEKVAEGDPGCEQVRPLREAGVGPERTPGPQGRESVQLKIVESPDPVRELPYEQGPQVGRDSAVEETVFWIPGQPIAASRPRVTRWGVFYGKKYAAWLEAAKAHVEARWTAPMAPAGLPLMMDLAVYVERSKSHYGTGRNRSVLKSGALEAYPWPRSDVDNYAKGPMDVLTGFAYEDDKQIIDLRVRKRFIRYGEEKPGVAVKISALTAT